MSIPYPGRVYQTATTTGTGTLTLSGSSAAALTWQSKFGAGPVPVLYLIQGASYFEMGRGVFTAPSTLTRPGGADVYSSSNSDALVVLPAATHDVFAWLPGEGRFTVPFSATKTLAISEWATIQQFTGSSAATFNLPAKANMPGGFHCTIQNDGTANLTIDPSGVETVEGVATVVVYPGSFGELSCDGTTWRFKSSPGVIYGATPANELDLTQTQNATSIASLFNDSTGAAAACAWALKNHNGVYGGLTLYGSNFTTGGMARQDGVHLSAAGDGGLTLNTTILRSIYWGINNVLKLTLDTSGNLTNDSAGAQPAIDNHGNAAMRGDGCIHASKAAGVALELNRTTDGTIANFRSAAVIQGSISISGATTSYNTSSDVAFKDDIMAAGDVGHLIDAAPVKQFTWKNNGQAQAAGFVAQDLTALSGSIPGLVNQRDDGMLEYDPSKLVPLLFKEIQSLRARLAAAGVP